MSSNLFHLILNADLLPNILHYLEIALVFILMISALVAAHELGHYLAARSVGTDVEEFAIGFGKKIKTLFYRGGTEFTLRLWPLGGFVRIKGMEPQEDGSEVNIPNGFYSKPPIARLWMLFAGPLFSLLFGAIILFGVFLVTGLDKVSNAPIIGLVTKDGPAAKAGLEQGDHILSVDGNPVRTYYDMISYIGARPEQKIQVTYEREGKQLTTVVETTKDLTPTKLLEPDPKSNGKYLEISEKESIRGKIGATPEIVRAPASFSECLTSACTIPLTIGEKFWDLITHPGQAKESAGSLGSIAVATAEATKKGFTKIFELSALLSISIGFMNLLPIPPLDGGQMLVAIIELFRRGKRLSLKAQSAIANVGFVLLMALILSVVWLDVRRMLTGDWSNVRMEDGKTSKKGSSISPQHQVQ